MAARHPGFPFSSVLVLALLAGLPSSRGRCRPEAGLCAGGCSPSIHPLPPLREQAKIEQDWAIKRVTEVIPMLMREYGVDMWILSMREYEEDPVFWAIKAPTTFAARRRSIYVFYDRGPGQELERLALGGGSSGWDLRSLSVHAPLSPWEIRPSWWGMSSGGSSGRWWRIGIPAPSP